MNIFQINNNNAPTVAKLMNEIKPDWWRFEMIGD